MFRGVNLTKIAAVVADGGFFCIIWLVFLFVFVLITQELFGQ